MDRYHWTGIAFLLAASACASNPPAAVTAAKVEQLQCDGRTSAESERLLLQSLTVLDAEPLYSFSHSSYMHGEERIAGAKLLVRPPADVTAEKLTRVLQCRNARLLLGQSAAAVAHDPYSLPDRWLNVEVTSESGNFAVTMSAETVRDNLAIWARAKDYAEEHMLASQTR
jgi:hypothetical protein